MKSTVKRRGRPKKLELDEVVETALVVLDSDGIDAVSFRRLAAELGVSHMTLYTYFDSKETLLNAMVARTLRCRPRSSIGASLGRPPRGGDEEIHAVLVERPGVAELLVTHQFDGAWVGEIREQLLGLLEPAGLGKRMTTDGISVLFNYLLGAVMIESSRGLGGSAASFDFGLAMLVEGLRRKAGVRRREQLLEPGELAPSTRAESFGAYVVPVMSPRTTCEAPASAKGLIRSAISSALPIQASSSRSSSGIRGAIARSSAGSSSCGIRSICPRQPGPPGCSSP